MLNQAHLKVFSAVRRHPPIIGKEKMTGAALSTHQSRGSAAQHSCLLNRKMNQDNNVNN
jgi:hypothetical protein